MREIQSSEQWAAAQVAGLPPRWRKRLLNAWEEKAQPKKLSYQVGRVRRFYVAANEGAHNLELREIVEKLQAVRLPLDAQDSDIVARADELAVHCMDVGRIQSARGVEAVREGMAAFCRNCGVVPPGERVEDRPAIARMTDGEWWRRGLRKLHAKAVEGAAIKLGYVHKGSDLYVSNESLERRRQQNRRNVRMLENTLMCNEDGQEFTLAELAARGVGNKAIRRGELMTRISGFEQIARECGHVGLFITATAPSRMHKWAQVGGGRVVKNAKYDDKITPRDAQAHLSKCWARARAALARVTARQKKRGRDQSANMYGFRIAEPHHDGCPHWHMLLFVEPWAARRVVHTLRAYWLADSPDEEGAQKYRIRTLRIDWSKGSAAGYVAKYVAKNIDGMRVGEDLFGHPAMETAQRVEAWAATWGIRQFQQIGGAPVGVWRELRRVKEVPEESPEFMKRAHEAVNKIEVGDETKSANWAEYCRVQGGVFVGRNARIQIEKEETGELGRYGEAVAPRPVGVSALGAREYFIGRFKAVGEVVRWVVKSVRHVWEVVRRAGRSLAPRTRVNNCTRNYEGGSDDFGFFNQSKGVSYG